MAICLKCGSGEIVEKPKIFVCSNESYNKELQINEGCDFKMWKTAFGSVLTLNDIDSLLDGETITKNDFISTKTNKKYSGLLSFDINQEKYVLTLENQNPSSNNSEDENGISEFEKGYKKNNVIIWKQIAGSVISYNEALALFNGEKVRKEKMVSKGGKEFSANLYISGENKIEFEFDNK